MSYLRKLRRAIHRHSKEPSGIDAKLRAALKRCYADRHPAGRPEGRTEARKRKWNELRALIKTQRGI